MELLEGLRTTGAVRSFRPDPVPDDVVRRLLDTARFAPNGGNAQSWHVVVLRDAAVRASVRDLYLDGWRRYVAATAAGLRPWAPLTDVAREREVMDAGFDGPVGDFAEHFDEVPLLLVVCADLRKLAAIDRDLDRYSMVGGASVYPFVWSVLLAAREEGLGGVITTMPIWREPELRSLLAVPDTHAVAAVVALGVPEHQPTKLRREGVESFTTVDRFDGPALDG
ncbi:MAG TPA: nitroreductase family protein [Acidimicrobiales bacterium]|nr:nitroreductase family protein [Acidimicrobiales bacterium]